jgi:DMSO/TMAO reductase YedYZ molybdopterin-dependent catalytic subunit
MTATGRPQGTTPPEPPPPSAAATEALTEPDAPNQTPQPDASGPTPEAGASGPTPQADASGPAPMGGYGFPSVLWRALADHPPPGLSRIRWRSPLRGPWLTSVFGATLLVVLPIVIVTGLLSYIAYGPRFGQAIPFNVGWLKLPTFDWPASPPWLYQLNQGLHVGLGLVVIPVVLAKLWSVIPRLFGWPPARSVAQVLERVTLLMLVGGILFEIVTGVLNIQYDYIFGFSFYTAHYFGAWVFIAAFVSHVGLKLPKMVRGLRSRSMRSVLRTSVADTVPEEPDPDGLVAADPDPPTLSRRGALAVVGGGALLVAVVTAGQTLGGFSRGAALLLPRGRSYGKGPNDFQINRTAVAAGIDPAVTGAGWRLQLRGRAGRDAAPHGGIADRLRGGVVHHADLGRCAAGRSGRGRRAPAPRLGGGVLAGAVRRIQPCGPANQPDPRPRRAVGASGQRRRPLAGSRLPGADYRARAARRAQHEMGVDH